MVSDQPFGRSLSRTAPLGLATKYSLKDNLMDDALFRKLLDEHAPLPPPASGGSFTQALSGPSGSAPSGPGAFTQAFSGPPAAPANDNAPAAPDTADNSGRDANANFPANNRPGATAESARLNAADPGITDPTRPLLDAPLAGAAEAGFQTKDFLTGETPEDQKSSLRQNAEKGKPEDGLAYGLSKGAAQFGVGLLVLLSQKASACMGSDAGSVVDRR